MTRRTGSRSARGRTWQWVGNHAAQVVVGVIVTVVGAVATPFITGWLQVEQDDGGGIRVTRADSRPETPSPPPATAAPPLARLAGEGDGPEASRLASDIEPLVRERLRASQPPPGLALRYRLSGLSFGAGASRQVNVQWAIGVAGRPGIACPGANLSFHSEPNLAERLAERLNASIAATETRREPTCG